MEVESPMIITVNIDVTLGLSTGHWSRQAWPQCDIIIDPNYHRTIYFRQVTQSKQGEAFLPFMYTGIQTSGDVHSITTPVSVSYRWPIYQK